VRRHRQHRHQRSLRFLRCRISPWPFVEERGSDPTHPRISHTVSFPAKVTLTNNGSTTLTIDTGQPLSIYLFEPDGTALVGASPGAVAGTGLGLKLLPGASHAIDAGGGTASCDLRLGYELPDGPYVARAAVEIDETSGPGYFWSDPVTIQLVTP